MVVRAFVWTLTTLSAAVPPKTMRLPSGDQSTPTVSGPDRKLFRAPVTRSRTQIPPQPPYASRLPSGDHRGIGARATSSERTRSPEPSDPTIISVAPRPPIRSNTIREPSGDHTGSESNSLRVIRRMPVPLVLRTYRPSSPVATSFPGGTGTIALPAAPPQSKQTSAAAKTVPPDPYLAACERRPNGPRTNAIRQG